ncbi:MAG: S8 family serine peptidase [Desulfobacteraceae bacterium]
MKGVKNTYRAGLALGLAISLILALGGVAVAKMMVIGGKKCYVAEPGEYVPGEVIVQLKQGTPKQLAESLATQLQGEVKGHIPEYSLFLIALPRVPGKSPVKGQVEAAMTSLKINPQVVAAFPNTLFSIPRPGVIPAKSPKVKEQAKAAPEPGSAKVDNVLQNYQWHLDRVKYHYAGAPPAAAPGIAIIDTGVDYTHPDLIGKVLKGYDYVEMDNDPMDANGHGTHCAGIAAGRSGTVKMILGISPTSKIYAVRVLDIYGSGSFFNIMEGIIEARENTNVKILSLSLGGYMEEGASDYNTFKKVIDDTVNAGKVVCVAAGNESNIYLFYYQASSKYRPVPAWFPNSFTVGATQEVDCRAYFSNYDVGTAGGTTYNYTFVDVVAPGWNILSCAPGGGAVRMGGTSMSCPLAAGALARVWAKYTSYTLDQVQSRLISTGRDVYAHMGFPSAERRVDLMKALGLSKTGVCGIVYNGQTGQPLPRAAVKVYLGTTLVKTVYSNYAGMFTATGLTGGKKYRLNFTKAGFSPYNYSQAARAGKIMDLYYPVMLNQKRPAGQWSILIQWHSWHPGYYDAYYTYPSKPSWYPYNWDEAAGTFFLSRLYHPSFPSTSYTTNTISDIYRGDLGANPYAALTTGATDYTTPCDNFVISKDLGGTYKVWARLDNINDLYYEWGKYKIVKGKTNPRAIAYLYYGSTLKATIPVQSATGTGEYWYIADITGANVTQKNLLQTTSPGGG